MSSELSPIRSVNELCGDMRLLLRLQVVVGDFIVIQINNVCVFLSQPLRKFPG